MTMKHHAAVGYRPALGLLLCAVLVLLGSCAPAPEPEATATPVRPRASVTPAPTLTNEPAAVYQSVLTEKRVISLVLEGYTDEETMTAMLDTLRGRGIPAVFFISGIVANEHPDLILQIAKSGFVIGNYGLNAQKKMQDQDLLTNVHQFKRGQELVSEVTGVQPTLFRANGSIYTRELLQAAASVGLQAGVQPNLYLNHASFNAYEDAQTYVQKLVRGSIVSIKLGQALDQDEFAGITFNMENLAIDPEPFLSDRMEDTISVKYANITNVLEWLLDALEAEGYTILAPQMLDSQRITMFDHPAALDADTLDLLDADQYALPITEAPLGGKLIAQTASPAPEDTAEPDSASQLWDNTLFVGDSITGGLNGYVQWRRTTEPEYMGTAQFATADRFGIGPALMRLSDTSAHPMLDGTRYELVDIIQKTGATKVLLMPGQADLWGYTEEQFIHNLKLMVYEIRTKNPTAQLYIQSVPPGVADRLSQPDNNTVFRYNLAMYRFCLEFDIPFLDVAYPLRDALGNLPLDDCLDADTYGIHLSDAGLVRWLTFLQTQLAP